MNPGGLNMRQAAGGLLALGVIVAASFFVHGQWQSHWATRGSAFTAPKTLIMACAQCGASFPSAGADYVARLRAEPDKFLVSCPKCNQVAARPATQCAACRKFYLAMGHDGRGYAACPHCKQSEVKAVPGSEPLSTAR